MRKVMVFGSFDGLHRGHLEFFRQAKKYGDYLMVVIARDSTIKTMKGRQSRFKEPARLEMLKKIKLINKVILGDKFYKYKVILNEKPDVICLGYDQDVTNNGLAQELRQLKVKVKIYRLKPYKPEIYKSSKLC